MLDLAICATCEVVSRYTLEYSPAWYATCVFQLQFVNIAIAIVRPKGINVSERIAKMIVSLILLSGFVLSYVIS